MGRVTTNTTSFAYAKEASINVLPASPVWRTLEPNTPPNFGVTLQRAPRDPITKDRLARKGEVSDQDFSFDIEMDLTAQVLYDFVPEFVMSNWKGGAEFSPTAVTATGYTVPSGGALPQNRLVVASGFALDANNGLKVVGASSTSTEVKTTGLSVESVAASRGATVRVAGVRSAVGDLDVDANGDITSTALDFTTLGLTVGQAIWVGGADSANQFSNAANVGFARVRAVTATKLTVDRSAFVLEVNTTKAVDILFGRFCRNVPVDDADFNETSVQFEAAHPGLETNGVETPYEYGTGAYSNTMALSLPLGGNASVTLSYVASDVEPPVASGSRKTNAAAALEPVLTGAYGSAPDVARLLFAEVDDSGVTTDFKSISITITNNVQPEKVIGQLGAKFQNLGNFNITVEGTALFTSGEVISAIRQSRDQAFTLAMKNDDGGFFIDVPRATLGNGGRDYPRNESVNINLTGEGFKDTTVGFAFGVSMFPFLPA